MKTAKDFLDLIILALENDDQIIPTRTSAGGAHFKTENGSFVVQVQRSSE